MQRVFWFSSSVWYSTPDHIGPGCFQPWIAKERETREITQSWLRETGRREKCWGGKVFTGAINVLGFLGSPTILQKDITGPWGPPSPRSASALQTTMNYSGSMTNHGLIKSQGETGPQKRREPRLCTLHLTDTHFVYLKCKKYVDVVLVWLSSFSLSVLWYKLMLYRNLWGQFLSSLKSSKTRHAKKNNVN